MNSSGILNHLKEACEENVEFCRLAPPLQRGSPDRGNGHLEQRTHVSVDHLCEILVPDFTAFLVIWRAFKHKWGTLLPMVALHVRRMISRGLKHFLLICLLRAALKAWTRYQFLSNLPWGRNQQGVQPTWNHSVEMWILPCLILMPQSRTP